MDKPSLNLRPNFRLFVACTSYSNGAQCTWSKWWAEAGDIASQCRACGRSLVLKYWQKCTSIALSRSITVDYRRRLQWYY